MPWFNRLALAVVGLLVVIQVFRPSRINPIVEPKNEIAASLPVPPEVADIFNRSCGDCHSNHTIWPWYSAVAPVSWLVAYDVNHGRSELNFSEWGMGNPKKNADVLQKICKEVQEKKMPGTFYPLLHPTAKLADADIQTVCRWTKTVQLGTSAGAKPSTPDSSELRLKIGYSIARRNSSDGKNKQSEQANFLVASSLGKLKVSRG